MTTNNSKKNSKDIYNATGKSNLLTFDPETLTLVTDPKHPLFDERVNLPVSEPLVLNILAHGVLEPVLVRKNPETGDVEVVVGRQRVKACREANKRLKAQGLEPFQIPGIVKRADDGGLAGMVVSENEIREDDSPIGRAKKAQRLFDLGKTEEQIAIYFGCSKQTVKNMVALLECCADVRNAVESGKIPVSEAYKLSKKEPSEQKDIVAKMITASESAKGKRNKSKAVREAAGGSKLRGKREVDYMKELIEEKCADDAFKAAAVAVLEWVLGGKEPKFPRVAKSKAA